MISVSQAIQMVEANTPLLPAVKRPLAKALGCVLAEDVRAGISLPAFNQSAMDGYAFLFADLLMSKDFTIAGEVAAGDGHALSIVPRQAVRIFTGAPVPAGLDTVVMQEKTEVNGNQLTILDEQLVQGSNVRKKGDEIEKGDTALPKGTVLSPAAIGFLAGLGLTVVPVYPPPRVHLVVTGKELQPPGSPLQYGQVYESNSAMLQAALSQIGISDTTISLTGDDAAEIASVLKAATATADIVILTGGVSVGDYDFVLNATETCQVKQLFHKVAQRPGKPLYAGIKEGVIVFGLPGNPASVLSCFYVYVLVAIAAMTGRHNLPERRRLPLLANVSKKIALTQFLKATYNAEGVRPLHAQESFRLSSFSVANCLLVLPEEKREYKTGESVEVLLLP